MPRVVYAALALFCLSLPLSAAPPGVATQRIIIDQFGYFPAMRKVAVISDPQQGFNATESYTPGALLEVRRWNNHELVYASAPSVWKNGALHDQSGDKLWWFDFSGVQCPGEYYVYDPSTDKRSFPFRVGNDIYDRVLEQATRMFFYQRFAYAKQPPFTEAKWADGASHLHDARARLATAPNDASTEKDLTGGWYDAGDFNKYVNFCTATLQNLLFAYQRNPAVWRDNYNIPESGNGIPDLLDEVKWELDWLLKMQQRDGSLLSKVAVAEWEATQPASLARAPRYYAATGTSSTLTGAINFAHASLIYRDVLPGYATQLREAALKAWDWATANPNVVFTNNGFRSADAEVNDYDRAMMRIVAAVHLYALTGDLKYREFVEANYQNAHALQWRYWYPFEPLTQDALLYFTTLPNVNATAREAIRASKQASMNGEEFLPAYQNATDPYRAYMKSDIYTWGSNSWKSATGLIFANHALAGLNANNASGHWEAAASYLHYLHGVNPMTLVMLTNMYAYGAEFCANEMYHGWFADKSAWDHALTSPKGPPPGYLTGGVNRYFNPDASYNGPRLAPPMDQPIAKSYRDWNSDWPENSWEITEPAIYYQAAYLNLLSTVTNHYRNLAPRTVAGACRPVLKRPTGRMVNRI